jgi:hypothetical protein
MKQFNADINSVVVCVCVRVVVVCVCVCVVVCVCGGVCERVWWCLCGCVW